MNKSERLTERVGDGIRYDNGEYIITCYPKNNKLTTVDKMAAKLCDLEDKIENKTLFELPCKVGDTVWCLQKEDGEYVGVIGEMFLAVAGNAVITAAFMYDFANDAEEAIEYYIQNTQDELSSDVEFYPLCDCFASREEAEKALEGKT